MGDLSMIDMILPPYTRDDFGSLLSLVRRECCPYMGTLARQGGVERKRVEGGIVDELAANVSSSSQPTCQLDR